MNISHITRVHVINQNHVLNGSFYTNPFHPRIWCNVLACHSTMYIWHLLMPSWWSLTHLFQIFRTSEQHMKLYTVTPFVCKWFAKFYLRLINHFVFRKCTDLKKFPLKEELTFPLLAAANNVRCLYCGTQRRQNGYFMCGLCPVG